MDQKKERDYNKEKLIKLTTVADETEAHLLKGFFDEEGVAVFLKHRHFGEFMQLLGGTSLFGVDLFVLENDLEEAKSLLHLYESKEGICFEEGFHGES